jgi:polysaccharide pyruvyl transferase WcaK-like protein
MSLSFEQKDLKKYRILIWGAWYGSHNIGDQLLLLTISELIRAELTKVTFTVLTDSPTHIQSYMRAESVCQFQTLSSRRQILRVINEIRKGDLFVFGGGVPFFQNASQVAVMAFLTSVCRFFKTPYATWSVSSQPVTSRAAKKIFGWVLNGAAFITCRDEHTRRLFKECGVRQEIHKTADSGFTFQPQQESMSLDQFTLSGRREKDRALIALIPRTLQGSDNQKQTHYSRQSLQDYRQEIACFTAALDWIWENGCQPIFVPMNTHGADDDRLAAKLCIQNARHGDKAILVDQEVRPYQGLRLLSQCRGSFTTRVHGSILSALAGCPPMMFAFQPKHIGIMEEMGLGEFNLRQSEATPENAVRMLSHLNSDVLRIRGQMQQDLARLQESAQVPLALLVALLQKDIRS